MANNIKKRYSDIVYEYVKLFCEKHDYDFDEAYTNDLFIFSICDYFIDFNNIMFDIDNNVKTDFFIKWYDFMLETAGKINYENFWKLEGKPINL